MQNKINIIIEQYGRGTPSIAMVMPNNIGDIDLQAEHAECPRIAQISDLLDARNHRSLVTPRRFT